MPPPALNSDPYQQARRDRGERQPSLPAFGTWHWAELLHHMQVIGLV